MIYFNIKSSEYRRGHFLQPQCHYYGNSGWCLVMVKQGIGN